MSRLAFAILISSGLLLSCHKSTSLPNGQIVGWNLGACQTCGGFYINQSLTDSALDSNTLYALSFSDNLLPVVNQFFSEYNKNHLPIPVSFGYQTIPNEKNWIRITSLTRR